MKNSQQTAAVATSEFVDASKPCSTTGEEGMSFGELLAHNKCYSKLKWLALSTMKNEADADDILQEACERALKAFPKFKFESTFSTWMHRIVANTSFNRLAQKNRQQKVITQHVDRTDESDGGDSSNEWLESQAFHLDTPLAFLEARETQDELAEALAKLERDTPAIYAALVAVAINKRDYEEVAAEAGIVVGTMRSRVHRARAVLKKHFRGTEHEKLFQ